MGTHVDWLQVIVLLFGNVAWVLPLWLWNRTESRADQRQMLSIVQAIQKESRDFQTAIMQEMKDFHGRLERQDAEFKGKLAFQDAEFKAHLMRCHKE